MSDAYDPKNPRLSEKQYAMIKRCSENRDFTEWNEWRETNGGEEIWLQGGIFIKTYCEGANFSIAHCEGANFRWAQCRGSDFRGAKCDAANFRGAQCEGADFSIAHCENAIFEEADCSGARFVKTKCQGTNFTSTVIDHRTLFIFCEIDDETDFSNSSLASMIVEPGMQAKLEQNIRRKNWEKWYDSGVPNTILVGLVRLFWGASDYGYSTVRVLKVFAWAVFVFASIYTFFPSLLEIGGNPLPLVSKSFCDVDSLCPIANPLQTIPFALSTMVTLGFSNINVAVDGADQASIMGTIIVSLNLMTGYFLLAVLVTRLSVLFQTLAPGWHPTKPEEKKK